MRFLSFILFLTPLFSGAQSLLNIHEINGGINSEEVISIHSIKFESGNLVLNKYGAEESYALSEIRKLTFQDDLITSAFKNEEEKGFLFYPNPVSSILLVEKGLETNRDLLIKVFSVEGHLVYEEKIYGNVGANSLKIDLSSLLPSTYIISIDEEIRRIIKL